VCAFDIVTGLHERTRDDVSARGISSLLAVAECVRFALDMAATAVRTPLVVRVRTPSMSTVQAPG